MDEVAKRVSGSLCGGAGSLKVEPMLGPWPDYLRQLQTEAFLGLPVVSDGGADIASLKAEVDLMRQTIAEMSRRPTQAAYAILAAELAALKVAIEPRKPDDPWTNALRWSV